MRSAANLLRLGSDSNDGVVLNIVLFWQLAPRREAKEYWQGLVEGNYEWSGIGRQLRERGLAG